MNKKVILITGATSDIGQAIVKECVSEKNIILLGCNNNIEKAIQIKEEFSKVDNCEIEIIKGNLEKAEEVERIIKEIDEKYGSIDILINNAALTIDTLVEDKKVEDFKRILNVNLIAPFLLSKHYGEKMYQKRNGKIINIASTNGIDTEYPEGMDYDASKAGLISLTKNFAKAYAPYVNVNAVAPGWVETKINENLDEGFKKEELSKILLERFAQPEEIAKVVKFLISEDASYINASVIRVDGGRK